MVRNWLMNEFSFCIPLLSSGIERDSLTPLGAMHVEDPTSCSSRQGIAPTTRYTIVEIRMARITTGHT
jgi:hypothetical protein